MADPNYLSPAVAARMRDLCAELLRADTDDVYWRAVDVHGVIGLALPDEAPGRLYMVWSFLTDRWELNPETRPDAEELMRDAARDFLTVGDVLELDRHLGRWYELLRIPE